MARSSNIRRTTALVLVLGLLQGAMAGPSWMNSNGPGSHADWYAKPQRCDMWGGPLEGFHVKTLYTGKAWNDQIVPGVYNQSIAADAEEGTAFINKDPADGTSGKYPFTDNFFCIPEGKYGEGYPMKDLPDNATTALQKAGLGDADGLPLQKSGNASTESVGYNALAEQNDYMLLLFGAEWCPNSRDFMARFAKYYRENKVGQNKSFDVVYFSLDETEEKYNTSYAEMPWKSAGYGQHALRDHLETMFVRQSVPFLAVMNKAGEVLTMDGVNALRGNPSTGSFPLPAGGAFFQKDDDVPAPCPIKEDSQIDELKKAVRSQVARLSDLTLQYYAKKVTETDMDAKLPEGDAAVREYVIKKFDEYIDEAARDKENGRDKITALYARLQQEQNDPANQVFRANDRIKVLQAFNSDSVDGSTPQYIPGNSPQGLQNTGVVLQVRQDEKKLYTDAILVKFDDSSFARRWVKASSYQFIQKIEVPKSTQSNRF